MNIRAAVDPLVTAKVIGDVIDKFVPAAELTVQYESTPEANGCDINPSSAVRKPHVHISGSRGSPNYTLVIVDPDARRPSEPTFREGLHWMVINIPEGADASEGKELMPYMGPQPPSGIHRCVFVAFKQKGVLEIVKTRPVERQNFITRKFTGENELGLPATALYFNSQSNQKSKKK
ncbi:protein MOTHER of FT and TFL1-like [Olea europaea var. sylvestris]|uniref:protein MOTHER of FT and TFL1-like n=1 Tax=Olea europaea var. sylvestris TaxID=158386 RepID=UPI000C1D4879|nr:protein MOTHER of FT and TFL1-like [Olea europaea var. sylvestris]